MQIKPPGNVDNLIFTKSAGIRTISGGKRSAGPRHNLERCFMVFLHLLLSVAARAKQENLRGWGGSKTEFHLTLDYSQSRSRSCALGAAEPARDGLRGTAVTVWSCWWAPPGKPCPPKDPCSVPAAAVPAARGGRSKTR